jgi:hypothetical protein
MSSRRHDAQQSARSSESAMIGEVYRGLVRIHGAIAVRTNDDTVVIPWRERELMSLVEKAGAFRREHRTAIST